MSDDDVPNPMVLNIGHVKYCCLDLYFGWHCYHFLLDCCFFFPSVRIACQCFRKITSDACMFELHAGDFCLGLTYGFKQTTDERFGYYSFSTILHSIFQSCLIWCTFISQKLNNSHKVSFIFGIKHQFFSRVLVIITSILHTLLMNDTQVDHSIWLLANNLRVNVEEGDFVIAMQIWL